MANKWQSSPFGTPSTPGVYAVVSVNYFTHKTVVLYIGSSKNIHNRVMNPKHPYRQLVDLNEYPVLISVKYKECSDFIDLERRLIKRLCPKYNLQHSGKEYRSHFIKL